MAYWAFDGSLKDSVGDLQATNKGTTFTESGVKGQALEVGADHYLVFNNPGAAITNLKSFTISFWMNAPQNTQYGYGVFSIANSKDFWGNLDIYLDNGSTSDVTKFKVHLNNGNAFNKGQFLAYDMKGAWDKWTQIVVTYDSSTKASTNFEIYQNGVSVYSTLIKDTTNNYGPLQFENATAMVIGTWQFETDPNLTTGTGPQPWAGSLNGKLDEFKIYDQALSAADINALYKLEKAGR